MFALSCDMLFDNPETVKAIQPLFLLVHEVIDCNNFVMTLNVKVSWSSVQSYWASRILAKITLHVTRSMSFPVIIVFSDLNHLSMMSLYTYSHFSSKHPRPQHNFFKKFPKIYPYNKKMHWWQVFLLTAIVPRFKKVSYNDIRNLNR